MTGAYKAAPKPAAEATPLSPPPDTTAVESTGIRKLIKQAVDLLLPASIVTWRYRTRENELGLTFDDSPNPAYTPEVLAMLRHYEAKATFFLVGERVAEHPRLVQQIAADGHEIANHAYHHVAFATLSLRQAREQIRKAEQIIRATGVPYSRLFRPPYGKFTRQALLGGWQTRHSVVYWSVDLKDYRATNAKQIYELMEPVKFTPGDVVLYHGTNAAALAALPQVIERMQSGAARLVTLAELAGRSKQDKIPPASAT